MCHWTAQVNLPNGKSVELFKQTAHECDRRQTNVTDRQITLQRNGQLRAKSPELSKAILPNNTRNL